ncbi:MAG: hypothetical protein BAJALOKI2v1_150012 [Promethearchaeota archaeon]|nr:MAG: hypothetical protein BAJALOKI2v1_150012 [Candidatus Lokiarchaeota archaeon]
MEAKFDFSPFLDFLFEWIDQFKLSSRSPASFSVKVNNPYPSLYGISDTVFNLNITNSLKSYFSHHPQENMESWVKEIQSYQNPKTGWFKDGRINFGLHFKEHSTAFAISALKLLDAKPKYPLKVIKKLNTEEKVHKWLKRTPEWGLLYWPGSHRGGGIGAILATLGPENYPHRDFFKWYFNWLDKKADPNVGFWRIGWIHKILKDRLTLNELGGAVHYYWIYEYMNRPIPYPEKVIDSTLSLQNNLGTWDKEVSYCIDLDALFCLIRCFKQTERYKDKEIKNSILKYLNYVDKTINKKNFLFSHYTDTHKLTGCVCAIAEIYNFMPELFESSNEWIQTLDITPWI